MTSLIVSAIIIVATFAGTAAVSAPDINEHPLHSYWIGR